MAIALISTRTAEIAYLFLLVISLANTAIINRSRDDRRNKMDDTADAEIIDDGNDRNAVAFYDILEDILSPPVEPTPPMAPIRKRTCYFNAGMSHSCDYNEVLKTVDDVNHWSSDYTPGRRRKRQHFSITGRGRVPITRSMDGRSTF